jgi:F0F1-type ATP synthase gamma subunit
MIPLNKTKKEVEFNLTLTQVVDALKNIALGRFHYFQGRLSTFEPFSKLCTHFLDEMNFRELTHPFVDAVSQRPAVVIVTSDDGFTGSLTTRTVEAGLSKAGKRGDITVIGERGGKYLWDLGRKAKVFPSPEEDQSSELAARVRDHVLPKILKGDCGHLIVVYPKPVSLSVQKITIEKCLPFNDNHSSQKQNQSPVVYLWESKPSDVLGYVLSQWVGHRLNEILAMSRIAELGARVVHLEGSHDELIKQGKKLKQTFCRSRHEVIDRSMREVFATQLLFRQQEKEESD